MSSPTQREPLQALSLLHTIDGAYYEGASRAHEDGKYVAWVNAVAPAELLYAMDVIPVYPENHAASIQAKKQFPEVAAVAEGEGYSLDLCSYALADIGSAISQSSPALPHGLPRPDFLLVVNSQCGTLSKWFEATARYLKAPYFLLDIPYWGGKKPDRQSREYVRGQFLELVTFIEGITGKKLDWDRFRGIIKMSQQTCDLWDAIIAMGARVPSPLTVFDQFVGMSPIVTQRGTPVALEFYKTLYQELEQRAGKGVAAIPGERHRLYWDNLPLWHSMGRLSKFLVEKQACLNANMYTWAWTKLSTEPEDPFGTWTEKHLASFFPFDRAGRVDGIVKMIYDYQLSGFIIHLNRSCKVLSLDAPRIKEIIEEKTGTPGVIIEADHGDPRAFSEAQVFGRLDTYFEMLN